MTEPDKVTRTILPSSYSNIFGSDLICPVPGCGAGAANVASGFRLDPDPEALVPLHEVTTFWQCTAGHQNATTCKVETK